jgi:tetratricopeptide (TPR) repeat protein
LKSAENLIRLTPLDCTRCLEFRGRVAELAGDANRAAWWFARAAADAPAEPFALTDWGAMLLSKGDFEGAIAKFKLANQKGPHFADPLEMWGEALVRENRSDLALAKFSEAAKYAPNWSRLHLKWGEALLWTGDKAGAEKQFDAASKLYLTAAEQSELHHFENAHV